METLIAIALVVIAYQLYELNQQKKRETIFISNDRLTSINPVFSEKKINEQQTIFNGAIERHSELWRKFTAMEKEEIQKHASSGGTVKDFIPSTGLERLYVSISQVVYDMGQYKDYLEAMIEANIAALNGTPIAKASETAIKRMPDNFGHLINSSSDKYRDEIIEERRKSYWEPSWKYIVSDEN